MIRKKSGTGRVGEYKGKNSGCSNAISVLFLFLVMPLIAAQAGEVPGGSQAAPELCVSCQQYKNLQQSYQSYKDAISQSQSNRDPGSAGASTRLPNFSLTIGEFNNLFYRGSLAGTSVTKQAVQNTNFYTPNTQDPLYDIYMKYDSFDDYRRSPDFNPQEATGLEYRYQTTGKGAVPEGGWKSRFVADVGILTPEGEINSNYQTQWSPLPPNEGHSSASGTGAGTGTVSSGVPGSYGGVEDIFNRYGSMDEYLRSPDFQPELANALEYRYRTRGKGPEPAGGWRTQFSDVTYGPGFAVGPNGGIPWGQSGGTTTGKAPGGLTVDAIFNRYSSMDDYLASPDFQPELANALEYRYRTRGKGPEPAGGWRTAFSDNTYAPGFAVGPNAGIPWTSTGGTGVGIGISKAQQDFQSYFATTAPGVSQSWAEGTLVRTADGAIYTDPEGTIIPFGPGTSLDELYNKSAYIRKTWLNQYGPGAI